MDRFKKNVGVLAACQGLLLVNNSVLITVNALAGYALAPDKALATLPVTAYFVGSALTTLPLSLLMKRIGRRAGFTVGAVFAILGSTVSATGVVANRPARSDADVSAPRSWWTTASRTLESGPCRHTRRR